MMIRLLNLLANNHVDMLQLRDAAGIAIKHAILSLNKVLFFSGSNMKGLQNFQCNHPSLIITISGKFQ